MKQIKSTELARNPSEALEPALIEPLAITHYRRIKYVVLSKKQYDDLVSEKENKERDDKESS